MGPEARKKKNQKKKQKQKQKKASTQHEENPPVIEEDPSQTPIAEQSSADIKGDVETEESQLEARISEIVDPAGQAEGPQKPPSESADTVLGEQEFAGNDLEASDEDNLSSSAPSPNEIVEPVGSENNALRNPQAEEPADTDNDITYPEKAATENAVIDTMPQKTSENAENSSQSSLTDQPTQNQGAELDDETGQDQTDETGVVETDFVQDLTIHTAPTQEAQYGQDSTEGIRSDDNIETHQEDNGAAGQEAGPDEKKQDGENTSRYDIEPVPLSDSGNDAVPDPASQLSQRSDVPEIQFDVSEKSLRDQFETELGTPSTGNIITKLGASMDSDGFQTTVKGDVEVVSDSDDKESRGPGSLPAPPSVLEQTEGNLDAGEIQPSAAESSHSPVFDSEAKENSNQDEDLVDRTFSTDRTHDSIEHTSDPYFKPNVDHSTSPSEDFHEQADLMNPQHSNSSTYVNENSEGTSGPEQDDNDKTSSKANFSTSPEEQGSESHSVGESCAIDDDLITSDGHPSPGRGHSAVEGNDLDQQNLKHSDELFASEVKQDSAAFPWEEEGDDFLSHIGQSESTNLSGAADAAEPTPLDETPKWLSQEQDKSEDLLPWEGGNEEVEDVSVIRNSLSPDNAPKNFSFLDNDDDLLDDDDSFLDSDEELTVNATTLESDTQQSAVSTGNSYLPQYGIDKQSPINDLPPVQSKVVSGSPAAHIVTGAKTSTMSEKKTTKYGPSTKIDVAPVSQIPSISVTPQIHPSVSSIRPPLPEFQPAQNINKKLDEEKKKSDAYDFPLDLTSRKPNKIRQPKPFGSVTSVVSSSTSSIASPKVSSAVLNSGASNVGIGPSFPVNHNAAIPGKNQGQSAPPMRAAIPSGPYPRPAEASRVSPVEQPQKGPYMPLMANNSASVPLQSSSSRYAPSSANAEPPKRANVISPYAPQTARARAFSNVSNGSAGSFGSSNGAGHIPLASQFNKQGMNKVLGGDQYPRPEAQAPLVPALKTIGLPTTGTQALSPNAQKRSHARSNSSVYAPAYSSKYAPTVQPQFHLPSQDNADLGYAMNPNQGRSIGANAALQRADLPSAIHKPTRSPPVDPNIAFHRQFPLFSWGSSSKVVYALPGTSAANGFFTAAESGLNIQISNYETIVKADGVFKSFPGPLLKNRTKVKDVQKWISDTCSTYSRDEPLKDLVLYRILNAKISQESTVVDVAKALYDSDDLLPFLSQAPLKRKPTLNASRVSGNEQLKVLAALQTGNHDHALELALAESDYALALMIGSLVGKDKWAEVVEIYLEEAFSTTGNDMTDFSSSLLTLLFRVSVGNSKRIFEELAADRFKANWAITNWNMIVAAVLSNTSHQSVKHLPDISQLPPATTEFLIEFGLFLRQEGSHLGSMACFVAADLPFLDRELVPGSDFKFCSLGAEKSWEGLLLSEVYEYYLTVRDAKYPGSGYSLLEKLSHALALIECGMAAEASKYVDAVTQSMKALRKNSTLACAVEIRLNFVSSRLIGTNAGWLGKPKLSQVWGQLDKSFNKFIGGDTEEQSNEDSNKIFENFTPSNSRNASLLDLSKEPLPYNPVESLNSTITPAFTPLQRPHMHTNVSSGGLLKGRKSSSVAESKYDPSHSQWSTTPNQKMLSETSTSAFESPIQPFYHKSPARSKDQLMGAATPPPLFSSTSSKKYVARRANPVGGGAVDGGAVDDVVTRVEADNGPQSHGQHKLKRAYRSERPVDAALLADLQAPPPPISGGISSYSSRRSSVQSRSSLLSKSSDVPPSKQAPMLAASTAPSHNIDVENSGTLPSAVYDRASFVEPSQDGHFGADHGDGDDLVSQSGETLKPEDRKRYTENRIDDHPDDGHLSFEALKSEGGALFETEKDSLKVKDLDVEEPKAQITARPDDEHNKRFEMVENFKEKSSSRADSMKYVTDQETSHAAPQASGKLEASLSRAKSAYAPAKEGNSRAIYNRYSPSTSQLPVQVDGNSDAANGLGEGVPDEQIDMFSYGGYNVASAVSTNTQDEQKAHTDVTVTNESPGIEGAQPEDINRSRVTEPAEIETNAGPRVRLEPPLNKKLNLMADDGDELFTSNSAPVIRPSSNPSFKPFTPASTPGAEEYYEDIIENESDDEDENENEKLRLEAEKKEAEAKEREAKEKAKKKRSETKTDKDGASWFGWLRKDANEKKPVKAKLGHQNTFYYDDKLQRWVNKNATEEEKQQISAPPPPPPIIKKKEEGSPKVKPRSGSVAGGAAARTAALVPPTNPFKESAASSTENPGASRSASPSMSPTVSLSGKKANNIDDLMSLAGTAGNQGGTRRKKKAGRGYVNVMNNM
ncbi:LAFA_0E10044g1_1 [Lachancea sp. 'fantastica']|nr:LAFA_0E10044g1_1 [Lachancea sp. 'fantastica']